MATSKVDICNAAAALLGVQRVQDIDNPTTKEEKTFSSLYSPALDSSLASVDWTFASIRKALAPVSGEETGYFLYAFALPENCLVPRELVPASADSKPSDFEIAATADGDSRILLCDEEAPVLRYTGRITKPTLYDSDFVLSFSIRLASLSCMALKGDPARAQELVSMAKEAHATAVSRNANTGNRTYSQQCDLLDARS